MCDAVVGRYGQVSYVGLVKDGAGGVASTEAGHALRWP